MYFYLGGFKVDFLTLSTSPAYLEMKLHTNNKNIKGTLSVIVEYEHFSQVSIELTNVSIHSNDKRLTKNQGEWSICKESDRAVL